MTRPRPTLWQRWIALLVIFYPARFRRLFGADLLEQYREPERGPLVRAAFDAGRELARGGLGARLDDARRWWSRRSSGGTDALVVDLRHTLRGLRRQPLFAFSVVATLALAAALNAAVFGILDAALIRPLPIPGEQAVVSIGSRWVGFEHSAVSIPEYLDYVDRSRTLSSIAAYTHASFNLESEAGVPERVLGARVTASFFDVFGVNATLGRVFTAAEGQPGQSPVAVLSHGLWVRQFGASPDVVGRTIRFDSGTREIIGVMPQGFRFPDEGAELWIPLSINRASLPSRGSHNRMVFARMAPGVTLDRAQQEMSSIARHLERQYPAMYAAGSGWDLSVRRLREHMFGDFRAPLQLLMAAVMFVLLIACANVANLMMARASERDHELATRAALGASRFRLARQAVAEGALLGAAGGVVGLVLGSALIAGIRPLMPEGLPVPAGLLTDPRAAGFSLLLTAAAGSLAAMMTTARVINPGVARSLRTNRATSDAASQRIRGALTATEVALAVMLLVASGVAFRSFARLIEVDSGLSTASVATARVTALTKYSEAKDLGAYFDRLVSSVAERPGVVHAGLISALPLSGLDNDWGFGVEGYVPPNPGVLADEQVRAVGGSYFQAMGIPLMGGRFFDSRDSLVNARVVIVSALAARKYWGDASPIGRRIRFFGLDSSEPWTTIVGVVGDIRNRGLNAEPTPMLYIPVTQIPERSMTIVARLAPGVPQGASVIGEGVHAVDSAQPVFSARMMDEWLARSVAEPRFNLVMLSVFGGLAIALAAVGIYGVMAFAVSRRTRELGIRVALGARPQSLLRLVLGRSLSLTAVGVAAGLAAGLAAALTLKSTFYGARVLDPIVLAAVPVVVLSIALLASYVPARRAMQVDPIEALRAD